MPDSSTPSTPDISMPDRLTIVCSPQLPIVKYRKSAEKPYQKPAQTASVKDSKKKEEFETGLQKFTEVGRHYFYIKNVQEILVEFFKLSIRSDSYTAENWKIVKEFNKRMNEIVTKENTIKKNISTILEIEEKLEYDPEIFQRKCKQWYQEERITVISQLVASHLRSCQNRLRGFTAVNSEAVVDMVQLDTNLNNLKEQLENN